MDGRFRDGAIVVGGDARQRFHDARGYGRPVDGALALAPVEAAHLLYRGDLDAVLARRGDAVERLDFRGFLAVGAPGFLARVLVYKDLRGRGFYLSPVPAPPTDVAVAPDAPPSAIETTGLGPRRDRSTGGTTVDAPTDYDFDVYPRGKGPWDDEVRYRVRAVGERADIEAAALGGVVLAVVDEEGEITYLETDVLSPDGTAEHAPDELTGQLLDDGVLAWDPPATLHERGFYGQPFDGRDGDAGSALFLSLVEAASLAARGALSLDGPVDGDASGRDASGGPAGVDRNASVGRSPAATAAAGGAEEAVEAIVERGREVEGPRFDRRLRAYRSLRDAGLVPKTGFKFGADFRVYREFDSPASLGHSEYLVRVIGDDHVFVPRDLALDVRLAGGVRKRMVFARPDGDGTAWVTVERLTP